MALDLSGLLGNLLDDVWFELTFLLTVALFASFLFTRFGQPRVIGYIVIGVIIGPSVLGIIQAPEIENGPHVGASGFPPAVQMLANLGAIVLLFMIGLECDFKEVYTRRPIAIAVGGVIVPWVCGYGIAHMFGYEFSESVFVGAALVATSVAVTASMTSELGLIGTSVANAIVGAAVVDDVLAMVVLGISKGLSVGDVNIVTILGLMVAAVIFVVVGAYVGSKILTKLVFRVQVQGYRRKMPMSGFILALAIAFLYSFIAETIGIAAIVGAFVAGTAFSGSALRDGFRKGTQYLEALFVPLFFVSLGVVVDVGAMWNAIWLGLALTAVAFASKVVGCGLPAYFTGMSKWDSITVGLGMAPRLEIALIIAFYGLDQGIINYDVYSIVVLMGLLTALFTPPLIRRSLKKGGYKFSSD